MENTGHFQGYSPGFLAAAHFWDKICGFLCLEKSMVIGNKNGTALSFGWVVPLFAAEKLIL
ncbi:hypothetical protein [Angelakisella massiliensis]|uniref:hypothetical protein n=1 Tax=Angelakisella massiliensis TaxID=1871018 RepID=UPI0024B20BF1|nr:hypothetical protein [Angelakisella massiliensis]